MDNQNNNTNSTINELRPSLPIQSTPVEGPPSPSQIVSDNVSVSVNTSQSGPSQDTYTNSQIINTQSQTMKQYKKNTQNKINNFQLDSDELIRAFIGPNYKKIIKRPFNFSAFFFTSLYYFYRKMNIYALIIAILQCIILYFFRSALYAVLIVNLLCCLITNKLYVNFSARKISKTLMNNPDKTVSEVKGMCHVIGGRSISRIIIFFTEILLMILLAMLVTGNYSSLEEFINNLDFSDIKIPEIKFPNTENESKFDGHIVTDKTNKILDNFNISTPSNFKPASNNNEYLLNYEYQSNKNELSTCSYQFGAVSGYSNPKTLISGMHDYYKDSNPSEIKKEVINSITWYTFNIKSDEFNIYYYASNKRNKVYLYLFIDEINSSNLCHSYEKSIINTISYK